MNVNEIVVIVNEARWYGEHGNVEECLEILRQLVGTLEG